MFGRVDIAVQLHFHFSRQLAIHAKLLIVFPIGLDQPLNAQSSESIGYAVGMNFVDFSTETLVSIVEKLVTDPTYKRTAQLASAILRDRRDTPAERVSAMIDHVIKYGDRHLRIGASALSTLQFLMFEHFRSDICRRSRRFVARNNSLLLLYLSQMLQT